MSLNNAGTAHNGTISIWLIAPKAFKVFLIKISPPYIIINILKTMGRIYNKV